MIGCDKMSFSQLLANLASIVSDANMTFMLVFLYGLVNHKYASCDCKVIGCVTGVIELLFCKTSAAANDVKA